jgi:hypothetical protein
MALTLDLADYPAVRRSVDLSLTKANVPDDAISDVTVKAAAERYVRTRTSNEDEHAKAALLSIAAARLMSRVPKILSETSPGFTYSRQSEDWKKFQQDLIDEADEEIRLSEKEHPTDVGIAFFADESPIFFDVAEA